MGVPLSNSYYNIALPFNSNDIIFIYIFCTLSIFAAIYNTGLIMFVYSRFLRLLT